MGSIAMNTDFDIEKYQKTKDKSRSLFDGPLDDREVLEFESNQSKRDLEEEEISQENE